MTLAAYPNPHLLVDTLWLADHLADPSIRIVDCDVRDAYRRAHIPGAVSPKEHYMKGPDSRLVMGPEQFALEMGEMGIGDGTQVVCYDASGSLYAARFWWSLRHYGHDSCVVVNGGWNKWLSEGRPATHKEATLRQAEGTPAAKFTPRQRDDVVCSVDQLKDRAGKGDALIWDVRSEGEWTGANTRGNKRAGHVPGAVHLEWLNCVTKDEFQTIKPAQELRLLLDGLGITPEKDVVTY